MANAYQNHTVSSRFALSYLDNAKKRGLCPQTLLDYAGVTTKTLTQKDSRLTPYQLARLLHKIMTESNDEFMGLAAHPARFGLFTLLAERLIHCSTLADALFEAQRFYRITTNAVDLSLSSENDHVTLTITLTQPHKDQSGLLTELLMLIWHRFPSWLIAQVIPLQAIHMAFPIPTHHNEYRLLFPCPAHFNQAQNTMIWHRSILEKPIQRDSLQLQRYLAKVPLVWFRKLHFIERQTDRVLQILKHSDELQSIRVEDVASSLHMTARTLRRKLHSESTQFQALKDQVRRERALYWLGQPDYSIKETAVKAGYTETTSFVRAFRNWTGMSPGQYRKAMTKK